MANRPGPIRLLQAVRRTRLRVPGLRVCAGTGAVAVQPGRHAAVGRRVHAVAHVRLRRGGVGLSGSSGSGNHAHASCGVYASRLCQDSRPGTGGIETAGRTTRGYRNRSRNLRAARKMTTKKMSFAMPRMADAARLAISPPISAEALSISEELGGSCFFGSSICSLRYGSGGFGCIFNK